MPSRYVLFFFIRVKSVSRFPSANSERKRTGNNILFICNSKTKKCFCRSHNKNSDYKFDGKSQGTFSFATNWLRCASLKILFKIPRKKLPNESQNIRNYFTEIGPESLWLNES